MKPRAKKVTAVIGLAFAVAGASQGCRTATQVEVVVTSVDSCKRLSGIAFIVGTDPRVAEARIDTNVFTTTTAQCDQPGSPSRIGSLVVTPNDETDHTSIIVLAGVSKRVEDCKPADGYFGCIIARRSFAFVPHTALTLEISLDLQCENVPCDAQSTCKRALCVGSDVSCDESGCPDVGVTLPDGGLPTVDAPTTSDQYVQGDHEVVPPTDAPVDAPVLVDAPADSPVGTDASSCVASDKAVTCTTNSTTKACSAGAICCYGFSSDGGASDGGDAGAQQGYDCRQSASCNPQNGNFNVICRGQENCPAGSVCCLFAFNGTYCSAGATCPGADAGMSTQVCAETCECEGGKTCTGTASVGSTPAQTFKVCQ